jgi:DNA ligase-1
MERNIMMVGVYGGADPSGAIGSEKFDGVRATWDGARLVSRDGVILAAPAWFTAGLPSFPLDGELWAGRGAFDVASGIARRADGGDAWQALRYVVFDAPSDLPYVERLAVVATISTPYAYAAPTWVVADASDLAARLDAVTDAGGEGLVIRDPMSAYHRVDAFTAWKVKRFADSEAVVVGHVAGKAGGLVLVVSRDGVTFRIGSGMTAKQRRNPPALGSVVTYRFDGLTSKGLPRFPRLVGVRYDVAVSA